jgi:hypothetical protein
VNFEQGHLDLAQMFAQQAVSGFRAEKAGYMEASAQAALALSLAAGRKAADARRAIDRAALLARKIEIHAVRLSTATLLARANAMLGKRAEARRSLEGLLEEATRLGLVALQLDIRLALGELEVQSADAGSGRAKLAALRTEASAKGYGLIARKADRLQQEPRP